jgi:hypothetical protein
VNLKQTALETAQVFIKPASDKRKAFEGTKLLNLIMKFLFKSKEEK